MKRTGCWAVHRITLHDAMFSRTAVQDQPQPARRECVMMLSNTARAPLEETVLNAEFIKHLLDVGVRFGHGFVVHCGPIFLLFLAAEAGAADTALE